MARVADAIHQVRVLSRPAARGLRPPHLLPRRHHRNRWTSRWHFVAHDGEEPPVNRPSRNTFKGTQDHVGSYLMSRHSRSDATVGSGAPWPHINSTSVRS